MSFGNLSRYFRVVLAAVASAVALYLPFGNSMFNQVDSVMLPLGSLAAEQPSSAQLQNFYLLALPYQDLGYADFDQMQTLIQSLQSSPLQHLLLIGERQSPASYLALKNVWQAEQNDDSSEPVLPNLQQQEARAMALYAASPMDYLADEMRQHKQVLQLGMQSRHAVSIEGLQAESTGNELPAPAKLTLAYLQRWPQLQALGAALLQKPAAVNLLDEIDTENRRAWSPYPLQAVYQPTPKFDPAAGLYQPQQLLSGHDSSILPFTRKAIAQLSPDELASTGFQRQNWLIIGKDSPELATHAANFRSLVLGDFSYTPFWMSYLQFGISLVLLLAFLLLFWIAPLRLMLFSALGVFVCGLFAQTLLMSTGKIWLPVGDWLGIACIFILAKLVYRFWKQLREQNHRVLTPLRRQLASYQLDSGDAALVCETLAACETSDHVLDLLYRAARKLEDKQDWAGASQGYQNIVQRDARYRDAGKRLGKIQAPMSGTQTAVMSPDGTLVMGQTGFGQAPQMLGRYQVQKEIGRGAMGIVYLGQDPRIGRTVALKTLDFQQFKGQDIEMIRDRFEREAEAAGRLNHPNIVTVFDVGEEPNMAYIAMDFLSGHPLSDFTAKGKLLPWRTVFHLLAQVADGLDYAHENGIVHRDIKPANLIYNADEEQVKITDFGIARVSDNNATRTGTVLGSPSYMSPEQIRGQKVDARSDIYSLGVCLYQLLCGELPFAADSLASLAYKITQEKARSVRDIRPDLPSAAVRITNKAMQKSPDKRYENMAQFREALLKAI